MSNGLTTEQTIGAINLGIQLLGGLADNILFASAFNYHLTKGVEFDEALEHTLNCLTQTKKRIPEYIKERSK